MTSVHRKDLWQQLANAGLVDEGQPSRPGAPAPWYVDALVGAGGWLSAILLLGVMVLALGSLLADGYSATLLGAVLCVAAYFLSASSHGAFGLQLALALSLAGQIALLIGLAQVFAIEFRAVGFVMAIVEIVLFFAMPGAIHRVWSAMAATLGLLYGFGGFEHGHGSVAILLLASTLVWLTEFRTREQAPLLRAAGYGLVLALILLTVSGELGWGVLASEFTNQPASGGSLMVQARWSTVALALMVLICTLVICNTLVILRERSGKALMVAGGIAATASLWAPGTGVALVVILLGLAHSNLILAVLGGTGLLLYLGHFYMATDLSLLYKAFALMATGVAILAIRYAMRMGGLTGCTGTEAADD